MMTRQNNQDGEPSLNIKSDVKRAVGFILYHTDKVTCRRCDVCTHVLERTASNMCSKCQSSDSKPHWREDKNLLLSDWYKREYDFPWETALSSDIITLLNNLSYSIGGAK